jgi:hypothetical protein
MAKFTPETGAMHPCCPFPPGGPSRRMGVMQSRPDPISRVESSGALRPVLSAGAQPALRHHPTFGAARSPREVHVESPR